MAFRGPGPPVLAAVLWLTTACGPGPSDSVPVIRAASFSFPALASVMTEVVRARQYDRAHGFRLQARPFGTVAAYYAALSRGEVDTAAAGPLVFQRMRAQGIPVLVSNTYATLASLVVIARSPELSDLSDLNGLTLAADMASSEYTILRLLASRKGVQLGRQIQVLQATPAVGRAHLMTGEAEAILSFEPTATVVLLDDPKHHVIFEGETEWEALGVGEGWLLVSLFHEEFAQRKPHLVTAFIRALRDASRFIQNDPEAADGVVAEALGLDSGVFLQAVRQGRIRFRIEEAADQWEVLEKTFQMGLELEFADQIPGLNAVFRPPQLAVPGNAK